MARADQPAILEQGVIAGLGAEAVRFDAARGLALALLHS